MRLKVAHFSFEYPPSTTGGLGIYLKGLVEHQRQKGDKVDVFFLNSEQAPPGTFSLPFQGEQNLLSYDLERIKGLNGGTKYDVTVCHDWAGAIVSRPLWKDGVPLVVTCHLPLAWDTGPYPDLPCEFSGELEFLAMAQADTVLAVSNAVKDQLQAQYPFTTGKITVVHHGTDTEFFSPSSAGKNSVLLYVGRFYENKGFDLLPSIFCSLRELHPDLILKIIGVGPLKAPVLKKFAALGLLQYVEFHDFSTQDVVLELYRSASVVIVPSRYEAFGLVTIESMSTATPVVASDVCGIKEIITHKEDGLLVASNDVAGFVEAVSLLLSDKMLASEMGHKARAKTVSLFDKKQGYERTRKIFADLI